MKIITFLFSALLSLGAFAQQTQSTRNDPAPGVSYTIVYQIGRFDVAGFFHGTDYNNKRYSTMEDCINHFDETVQDVRDRAADKNADLDVQEQHAQTFVSLYKCQQITIDPNYNVERKLGAIAKAKPSETVAQPQAQVQTQPQVITRERETAPQSGYMGSVEAVARPMHPMPTRAFYIAQYVDNVPGYRPYWIRDAIAFPTIGACYAALKERLAEEQGQIEARFMRTARDGYAAVKYSYDMAQFKQAAARKMQCVMENAS